MAWHLNLTNASRLPSFGNLKVLDFRRVRYAGGKGILLSLLDNEMIDTESPDTHRIAAVPLPLSAPLTAEASAAGFDSLYSTYLPLLRKIAIGKFAVPAGDAEALAHDVFATYLSNPGNVRNVHAYLVGAICNAARQYRRRDAAERTLFCGTEICEAEPTHEMTDEVMRTMVVNATLARLGASCRETLRRFYLIGESAPSIAATRNTSTNYVLRLLSYCRKRARAMYEEMHRRS